MTKLVPQEEPDFEAERARMAAAHDAAQANHRANYLKARWRLQPLDVRLGLA